MITVKAAKNNTPSNQKFGLALAGGGPLGAFYELGALCAIEDSISPLEITELDVYVGVSAGAFIAAGLANGIDLKQMAKIFAFSKKNETPFNPDHFLQPAYKDYVFNLAKTPGLVSKTLLKWAKNPLKTSVVDMLEIAGKVLPAGVFNNEKLEEFLKIILLEHGQTNDFSALKKELYVVACELNSGKIAGFGNNDNNHVPISKAVQASSALPGLYSPVKINGKFYVDGALRRTMNASAALKKNTHLLFAVNPIVPFERTLKLDEKGLVSGGLPLVLSQTFRSIVQSRLKSGLDKYESLFPSSDIILFEPDANDETLFKSNLFSYSKRDQLCDYAYRSTRKHIIKQKQQLEPILKRHGLYINEHNLVQKKRKIKHFIDQKHATAHWSEALGQSLDSLERTIRSKQ
ncbi:patatin-like phospholipase family protein [Marinicella sp. S1101]|uniref:patatin-like phospholipase family protein n=1 Tax=Marinicella marina TaxID=2996016 RepID=UPI002260DB8D|nr:patatin-like phospholipase family protein [Marinicella marina]MCX7554797.1 patatin-like phospholipase family protein [Marinicella marina]MDJ1140970.1 patatin-like phospholipase family protein [Marinicella marina]